ncbi:MAG: hypothetical protein GYA21_16460 [Myxococcales bacterium]|nr:hypothetical protein [Myxococcales bacterium]
MDQGLLDLRPVHVMHRLGAESRVPLLNGRTLLDACAESAAVLWAPRIASPAQARALLLAACHRRAMTGAVLAPPRADLAELRREHAPASWMDAFLQAAAEMDEPPPFCLHVQAPPFDTLDSEAGRAVAWLFESCLESGFTSFGVDLGTPPAAERVDAAVRLLGPGLELELCVVLRLGVAPGTEAPVLEVLRLLRAQGVLPDLLWLSSGAGDLDDLGAAGRLAPLVAPAGVALDCLPPNQRMRGQGLAEAGVRALWGDDRLLRLRGGTGPSRPEVEEAGAYLECVEAISFLGLSQSARLLSVA